MVTCIHALEAEAARKEKNAKKKADSKKKGWTACSITTLSDPEKRRIRPLPLHLESLMIYFVNEYNGKERETEERVGEILCKALAATVPAPKDGEKPLSVFPYCRVCDLVYSNVDSFYEHILSEEHTINKESDSLPLFEDVATGEELTRNQMIAREFMGPALLPEMQVVVDVEEDGNAKGDEVKAEAKEEGKKEKKKPMKKDTLTDAQLGSLAPKEIVEFRLKQRPCADCSRIWEEYGSLISGAGTDLSTEFAFRSHPVHPCVALLHVTLECFKGSLEVESDEATRATSTRDARPVKYPSKDQLKELAQEMEYEVAVFLDLRHRHCYACNEEYQVAMHCRAGEIKKVYDRFMEGCRKRDEEGRRFFCDICTVVLPSSRHFRLHLLSEAHDKKMGKAPTRQSSLYNPLCQMVCFIDAVSLLQRKKLKKIEKKDERKEERRKERARKEKEEEDSKKGQKVKTASVRKEKGKKVEGGEKKEKGKKEKRKRMELTIQLELDPHLGFKEDRRGFLVYRVPPPAKTADGQKKVIEVIRRQRTESEKAADEIVYKV